MAAPLRAREPTVPFAEISVDLMGPYVPADGKYRYILVVADMFTRWTEAFALETARAPEITKILEEEVFFRYGFPQIILTDNGPQFTCETWRRRCRMWRAKHHTSTIYMARQNPVERRNQEIKKSIRFQLNGRHPEKWNRCLPRALFNMRRRENAATKSTPAHLLFGFELPRPGKRTTQRQPDAATRHAAARARQREYTTRYAPRRAWPPDAYVAGDHVMVKATPPRTETAKFAASWDGPVRVIKRTGAYEYCLLVKGREVVVHVDRIKHVAPADYLTDLS